MKKFLGIILLFVTLNIHSQTVVYDNMETFTWSGDWWRYTSTGFYYTYEGFYTNASVSPTQSAVIYGLGNGSSANEQDWYSLPNVTGLNPTRQYEIKFRLGSYRFTSTATTRGVDAADLVEVQVSTNGGTTFITELRIIGNSNAYWNYNTNGVISHTANGSFTNSAGPTGDVYQSGAGNQLTSGPSVITLTMPVGITQIAVDILCRVNSAGEEWWIDNVELYKIPSALPIELISFEGKNYDNYNVINWATASEINTDKFIIKKSQDGVIWKTVGNLPAAGNSTQKLEYSLTDMHIDYGINYYELHQYDINGEYKIYGPIAINNIRKEKRVVKVVNLLGQEVNENESGILLEVYEDGTVKKIIR